MNAIVCAFCGVLIGNWKRPPSYGICADCVERNPRWRDWVRAAVDELLRAA